MTKYHKNQAEKRYLVDGYVCQVCGRKLNNMGDGLAHRMANSKMNLRMYGEKRINHNFNLVPACMKCNSKVLIDGKPQRKILLISLIDTRGEFNYSTKEINSIIGVIN